MDIRDIHVSERCFLNVLALKGLRNGINYAENPHGCWIPTSCNGHAVTYDNGGVPIVYVKPRSERPVDREESIKLWKLFLYFDVLRALNDRLPLQWKTTCGDRECVNPRHRVPTSKTPVNDLRALDQVTHEAMPGELVIPHIAQDSPPVVEVSFKVPVGDLATFAQRLQELLADA